MTIDDHLIPLLKQINSPEQLRALEESQLPELASELTTISYRYY